MALKVFKNQNYDVSHVRYTKKDGTSSERDVIVIAEPVEQYKVLEVTDLTIDQRHQVQALLRKHKEELAGLLKTLPTEDYRPRWKNMDQSGLEFLNGEGV